MLSRFFLHIIVIDYFILEKVATYRGLASSDGILSLPELHILLALWNNPTYGLDLSESIQKLTDNRVCLPIGTVYPILKRLEENGLVEQVESKSVRGRGAARRNFYQVTLEGSFALARMEDIRKALANHRSS